jgi:hypothetical protein
MSGRRIADDGISTVFRRQFDEARLPKTALALFRHAALQNSQSASRLSQSALVTVSVSLIARRQLSFELRRASEFFFDFARVNRK